VNAASKLKSWLKELCQSVGGDWLLVGGSLALIEFGVGRATHDIDLIDLAAPAERVRRKTALLLRARTLGITPEQLNSAADFFVNQCVGWESHLVKIEDFGNSRIFRPNLTLYLALKLNRGTPIDVKDAQAAWACCPQDEFSLEHFKLWASARAVDTFKKHFS
jgi:hypothetical protein